MNILCIATLSSCWDLHGKQELTLLAALRERGASVDYVICDGLCGVGEGCANYPSSVVSHCLNCWRCGSRRAKEMGFTPKLLQGISRFRDTRRARAWAASLAPEDFNTARYGEYELGRWAYSSMLTSFFLNPYVPGVPLLDAAYRQYLEGALREAWAVERHLGARAYDRVILFNGRIAYTKVVLELARKRNIPVYVHERGNSKEHINVARDEIVGSLDLARRFWDDWKDIPLTRTELGEVSEYLYRREHGDTAAINWAPFSSPPGNTARLRHDLGIAPDKRIWALFTSSTFEFPTDPEPGSQGFASQWHWLEHALAAAARYPDVHMVVRAHPNLNGHMGSPPADGEMEYYHALKRRVTGNVTVVEPHEPLSTYDLMNLADVGIAYSSTCGLEMAAKGKPASIGRATYYDGMTEIGKAFSPEMMDALFQTYAALPRGHTDVNLARMAFRFWHSHVFRKSFPFPFVRMPGVTEGEYAFASTRELAQGNNAVLDHLCLAIERGERPQWRPGTEPLSRTTKDEDDFWAKPEVLISHCVVENLEENIQPPPFVSIIIPTYNRAALLPLTLDSILAQDYPADRFEIIVGDNNSPDATQAALEEYARREARIRPFFEPRQGVHYVRNRAAHLAQGEILYYTDDDMIADPSMLRRLVAAFADSRVGAATGKVLPRWEAPPPAWVLRLMQNGLLSLHDAGDKAFSREVDFGVWSCHQAVRREVLFRAGGFNPENTAGVWIGDGETGLNIKIKRLGYHFAYAPGAVTYHIIPPYRLTQRYLNNRLAKQGNCDSYTAYRRDRPTAWRLARRILGHIVRRPSAGSMLTCLLQIPWRLLVLGNSDGARMALGTFFYCRNRLLYDCKLLASAEWRALVMRDDWLEKEAPENS